MEIRRESEAPQRMRTELLVVPLRSNGEPASDVAALDQATGGRLLREARQRNADPSKPGSTHVYQTHGELPADQIALIGVGSSDTEEDLGSDGWRRFAGQAIELARRTRSRTLALSVGSARAQDRRSGRALGSVVEGTILASYRIKRYKSNDAGWDPTTCAVLGAPSSRAATQAEARGRHLAEATCFARDLINEPAGNLTPAHLAAAAEGMRKEVGLEVKVYGPSALEKMRMGAILAVGRGSVNEPRFVELIHRPKKARGVRKGSRAHVALVGKGITFDSGGLNLKPAHNMEIQKRDMAGAAAVLGAMRAISRLELGIEVRGYLASAENMPSGDAYRPGDVLRTYSGKTVEVLNTDAEGRLVLADALGYASRRSDARPRWIVDIATLTGAVSIALGRSVAGVMGNDARLVQELIAAGRSAGESLWELPLVDEYVPAMESLVADLKNTGDGSAGSIFGGLFLREFVDGIPWAHLDIAGVAWTDKPRPCAPRGAVGFGVRTLVELVEKASRRA